LEHCSLLEDLVVSALDQLTDDSAFALIKKFEGLKNVDIRTSYCCQQNRSQIVLSSGQTFHSTNDYGARASFLEKLALSCHGLTVLRLQGISQEFSSLLAVLDHCSGLTLSVSYSTLQGSADPALPAVRNMSMCALVLYQVTVTAEGLSQLLRACRSVSLSIATKGKVTGMDQVQIGTYCPALEELDLDSSLSATDAMLLNIGEHCMHLRRLSAPNSRFRTAVGLIRIAQECPLLEELELCESKGISNDAVLALARCARNLQSLDMRDCYNCKFTDHAVAPVMAHCSLLTHIDVRRCPSVSGRMRANARNFRNIAAEQKLREASELSD
jgi:hypothetical protein